VTLADEHARERIRGDLDASFVVEAAAGTGKTTELIRRMVTLLRSGRTSLTRIAAVTFTEKAAGEMKLRLRAYLDEALGTASEPERAHLERALADLELAHINTIHGFCADLLRERPIEAGVDPAFEVLDDLAGERLLGQAFDDWFEHVLADPPEGVRRALRRATWRAERMEPREQLLAACAGLTEHRDFRAPYGAPDYDRKAQIDTLVAGLHALAELAPAVAGSRDRLALALQFFAARSADVRAREATRPRDHDWLEAELRAIANNREWRWQGGRGRLAPGLERSAVLELRERVHAALRAFLALAEADLAAKLQRELLQVVDRREELKRASGALDFLDLLLCARDLLVRHRGVRRELRRRFTHVFVDEFQDIDPLQAEILMLLAAAEDDEGSDPLALAPARGKLFVVGDPKQSIYRFRRADVTLYERIKARLVASGAELLQLHTSFRALPAVQAAVNVAFERLMTGAPDGSQPGYVALTQHRAACADQPAVVALPVPKPYGAGEQLTKRAVDESYPDAVGAFIDWLLRRSGWTVEEDGLRVPVQPRHVCLLFRRFQPQFGEDKTRSLVRALEARGIPHVLVGGRSLHGREEVIALRAAMSAIEWPDDELSVYATLRGPFFALGDDELLCLREALALARDAGGERRARARLHPLADHAAIEQQGGEHAAGLDALGVLGRLHRGRNRRPIADTLSELLEVARAHASVAIWPTGEQALANLLAVIDAARAFEARGAVSFRGFVEWIERQSERGTGSEATIVEEGTEGVRLMTIHKAKGLEFPVVVLCDPTASITPATASRYTDVTRGLWAQRLCGCRPQELIEREPEVLRQDEAENVRLAYVAATRARDLLVVPAFGDGRADRSEIGWVDVLAPSIYPAEPARRSPRPAPGCPPFGDDSVLSRRGHGSGIRPGLHGGAGGATEVVWWDPAVLELDAQPMGGLGQQQLLVETERSAHWLQAYAEFRAGRDRLIERAATPTLPAHPVTQLAALRVAAPGARAVAIERTPGDRSGRPRGAQFGALVHAMLAYLPLDADDGLLAAVAVLHQRVLAASDREASAAIAAVSAALAHPLLRRAARSPDCRREVPLLHRLTDGSLARGVADLVFREAGGWVVVDFKTDAELLQHGERYAQQVRLYMEAVHAATGADVQGALLLV
jgi:ATP-dependent exoDNAse (exonuclease V) beta subunit